MSGLSRVVRAGDWGPPALAGSACVTRVSNIIKTCLIKFVTKNVIFVLISSRPGGQQMFQINIKRFIFLSLPSIDQKPN